jgi:uncharacterized membrane protein YqgA involved in biofilm formation
MPGLGVIVNVVAVLLGTAIGLLFGRLIAERFRLIAFPASVWPPWSSVRA